MTMQDDYPEFDDPETCSWCFEEVEDCTLIEQPDGARICEDCDYQVWTPEKCEDEFGDHEHDEGCLSLWAGMYDNYSPLDLDPDANTRTAYPNYNNSQFL